MTVSRRRGRGRLRSVGQQSPGLPTTDTAVGSRFEAGRLDRDRPERRNRLDVRHRGVHQPGSVERPYESDPEPAIGDGHPARRTGLERLVLPGRRDAVGRPETVSGPSVTHLAAAPCRLRGKSSCDASPRQPAALSLALGGLLSTARRRGRGASPPEGSPGRFSGHPTARERLCGGIEADESSFPLRVELARAAQPQGGDQPNGHHSAGSTGGLHLLLPSLQPARELCSRVGDEGKGVTRGCRGPPRGLCEFQPPSQGGKDFRDPALDPPLTPGRGLADGDLGMGNLPPAVTY